MTPSPPAPRNGEDRARALLSGMARCARAFRQPESWPQMPDQAFQHMAFLACLTYHKHPDRTLRMFRLFADLAKRFSVPERLSLLGTVWAFVEEGRASAEALMPFVLFDESDAIIAAAAREFAVLHLSPSEAPLSGAAFLLARLDQVAALPSRKAPVIAGLVSLGDMRLAPLLLGRRDFKGAAARRAMACADGAFATTLHVEFLLDWLEHADSVEDAVAAADSLAAMPRWAIDGVVTDVHRIFPSTAAPLGEELSIKQQFPFAEYLPRVRPRLAAVAMLAEVPGTGQTIWSSEDAQRLRGAIEGVLQAWNRPAISAAA